MESVWNVKDRLAANKHFIFILLSAVLFIGIAYYVYTTYVSSQFNRDYIPNKEYVNANTPGHGEDGNTAKVMFFWASWCPHSKVAKPEWEKLVSYYQENGDIVNGYKLQFEDVNCDNADDTETSSMLNEYKIEGYPTIKLIKGNEIVEYNAKTDVETLKHFIDSVLQ